MRAFVASPCVGVERAARVLRAPHRKEIGKRPCGRRWGADGKPSGCANEGPYSQICNLHIALRLPRCYPSLSAAKIRATAHAHPRDARGDDGEDVVARVVRVATPRCERGALARHARAREGAPTTRALVSA